MTSWQGKLELVYGKQGQKTQILRSFNQAPLKVQRPFYPEGEEICQTIALHTAGGIVGGDRLSQSFHLQADTQVLSTTAAAAKIYGTNGQQANQTVNIRIENGASLEWLPQPIIVFNNALYRQEMRVDLASQGRFFGWEIVRFGRSARGEIFQGGEWRSLLEIWRDGKLLWCDRQWLLGDEATFYHPQGLGGFPIIGSLIAIGERGREEAIAPIRHLGETSITTGEIGVTQTLGEGFLCRYRGQSMPEVKHWFSEIWKLSRKLHGNRVAIAPRVWL